ncbi:uncharacterized protein LOC128856123 [Anastrepha ludens]|uniref:uncharacterized protein LOC128856123 n=1 Tax=Anastrepha ludens TaxID=28586 RepID=UPI0023B0821B|nr:uncharacterized protein LOC128856123 [Anastrepha ludens]
MSCFARQSECGCCSSCNVHRNRPGSDCFPTRLVPDMQIPSKKPKCRSSPIKPTISKTNNKRAPQLKNEKRINFPFDSEHSIDSKGKQKCQCDPKQTKNKQNFQYQDLKKRMEVISEEAENDSDGDEQFGSKSVQNSCADFLNIVHDTVLETVQSSVEGMMRNYFAQTAEKIETLCSQMMRNECLLSKMYLDVLDKLEQQNEKSLQQFKCLCQFIVETQKEASEERVQNQKCCCPNCGTTEEVFVSLAREKALSGGRHLSDKGAGNGYRNFSRNGGGNVRSEQNLRHHRDFDNEPKTHLSLTSCTNSLSQLKSKTGVMPTSCTSMSNKDIPRNIRRLSTYSDSGQFWNCNNRRSPQQSRVDENCKIYQNENRMEEGKYGNVKRELSDTIVSKRVQM